jgi:hypothetical protein
MLLRSRSLPPEIWRATSTRNLEGKPTIVCDLLLTTFEKECRVDCRLVSARGTKFLVLLASYLSSFASRKCDVAHATHNSRMQHTTALHAGHLCGLCGDCLGGDILDHFGHCYLHI